MRPQDEFEKQVNTTCEKVHGADEISKGKCVKGAAKLTNGEGKGVREAVEKVITIKKDLKAAKSMSMTALKLRANLYYAKGQAAMKGYSYSSALKAFHKQEPCVAYWMTDEQQICGNENKVSWSLNAMMFVVLPADPPMRMSDRHTMYFFGVLPLPTSLSRIAGTF